MTNCVLRSLVLLEAEVTITFTVCIDPSWGTPPSFARRGGAAVVSGWYRVTKHPGPGPLCNSININNSHHEASEYLRMPIGKIRHSSVIH
jgi:hypothetical protein